MVLEGILIVLRNVGLLLRYMSWLPLLLLGVSAWYDEWTAMPSVLSISAILFGVGFMLSRIPAPREPRLREGLVIAAVGWILVPLASVPLFLGVEGWGFVDAYFETMSAWTGTGMSLADVTVLSHTTLAWRSLMQWVGGLGVIVLTLAVLARPGTGAYALYVSEAREDKLRPSVLSTVRTLWWIYAMLTGFAILLLLAVGLAPWHALNHGLTAIATGGMSVTAQSIGEYGEPAVEWAILAIMVIGALPFVAHYAWIRRQWGKFLGDEQVKGFFLIFAVAVPVVWWMLHDLGLGFTPDRVRVAAFQVGSALSSTGFSTVDLSGWSPRLKMALAGIMLVGGAAGSTAGGLKIVRGVLLVKGAFWKLERSGQSPFAVTAFRFSGRAIGRGEANEEFAEAAFIGVLWILMLFVGLLAVLTRLPPDVDLANAIFDLASAQSNIGLSTGVVSPDLPASMKLGLMGVMWAGRLEILPVLLLLRAFVPGKR